MPLQWIKKNGQECVNVCVCVIVWRCCWFVVFVCASVRGERLQLPLQSPFIACAGTFVAWLLYAELNEYDSCRQLSQTEILVN